MGAVRQQQHIVWGISMLVLVVVVAAAGPQWDAKEKVKGGYWPSGMSPASRVNSALFTHMFYAFAEIENGSSLVKPSAGDSESMAAFSATVKSSNPDLKTLISISASGEEFAAVMASDVSREAFINSSITLARSFQFDGLDLDYEFPQSDEDMNSFSSFLSLWRNAVSAEAATSARPPLLLTAAVYYARTLKWVGKGAYPIESIANNLDFVNIMCYDFHGSWNVTATGANANLYDPHSTLSADFGITSWLDAGLPPEKAVLGLTLYGRSWVLKNQTLAAGLDAPAVAAGPPQPLSQSEGVFFYSEVTSFIAEKNATVVHDKETVSAYCYADDVWITYEDPIIITAKVNYAASKRLRGYFFWAITQDSNWEDSAAASEAMDSYIHVSPASGPALPPSSSSTASALSAVSVLVLLSSLILLLQHSRNTYQNLNSAPITGKSLPAQGHW